MKTIEKLKTMKTRFSLVPVVLMASVMFVTSCNNDDDDDMVEMKEKNVVETAASAGQFTILLEAAQKAGLADYLSNTNGITVYTSGRIVMGIVFIVNSSDFLDSSIDFSGFVLASRISS